MEQSKEIPVQLRVSYYCYRPGSGHDSQEIYLCLHPETDSTQNAYGWGFIVTQNHEIPVITLSGSIDSRYGDTLRLLFKGNSYSNFYKTLNQKKNPMIELTFDDLLKFYKDGKVNKYGFIEVHAPEVFALYRSRCFKT